MSRDQVMTTNSLGRSRSQNFRDNMESRFPSRTVCNRIPDLESQFSTTFFRSPHTCMTVYYYLFIVLTFIVNYLACKVSPPFN
jgi:hypothetical protein